MSNLVGLGGHRPVLELLSKGEGRRGGGVCQVGGHSKMWYSTCRGGL